MNKTFELPFGETQQILRIDEPNIKCDLVMPIPVKPATNPGQIIQSALKNLNGEINFSQINDCTSVAIAINDKTRPVPHEIILPPLLDWLHAKGVRKSAIKFWIATGSHLPMPPEDFHLVIPKAVIDHYSIVSHDINYIENLINLGITSRGTPIIVNRQYFEADIKIVVGDIEPHHFAGFSGGYKTAAIGLAGRETINRNHAMLVDPNSWIGVYEPNPLRQDINEIGKMISVDLALNTILNSERQVVAAVAGGPDAVMQKGIPISRAVCGTPVDKLYDVIIASAGGHPKDINFYQAQKALTHASLFCKPGGTLILVAACAEGSGSKGYEEFMHDVTSVKNVFEKFQQMEFRVGPHKAFQVARLLDQFRIILVSLIPPIMVESLLLESADTVQQAYDRILSSRRESCSVAILPHATTTLPAFETSGLKIG